MSTGARHILGVLLGIVVVPAIFGALFEANERQKAVLQTFQTTGTDHWAEMACFAAVAVIIGGVSGSRISPLASLVPGLVIGGFGVLWVVQPNNRSDTLFPAGLRASYVTFGVSGLYLVIGGALLVASLFPARWRHRFPASAGRHSVDNADYGDTPQQPGYDEYAGGAPALQYGDQGQLYSQNPDYKPGSDIYGRLGGEPERPGWAGPPLNSP